jgi:molybdopterin converting factor small subunit
MEGERPAPKVRVTIPQVLRSLCGGDGYVRDGQLCIIARDVRGLLAELARQHPRVHTRVCDERGEPRPHINVFVNDDHIQTRAGLDTPLAADDSVAILPAVSGG